MSEALDTPHGPVSLFWDRPSGPVRWGLALAHGAGTRADHPALLRLAAALAERGFAVLRFNFPYAEAGRKPPDRAPVLLSVWEAVWSWFEGRPELKEAPRLAGGRSMGGRMASLAASSLDAEGAPRLGDPSAPRITPDGLVFFAYPLHPPGRPDRLRAGHLPGVAAPMLFLSGTRDTMAKRELLDPVLNGLGKRGAIHWIDAADHGFKALKRSGRTEADITAEAATVAARWAADRFEAGKRGARRT